MISVIIPLYNKEKIIERTLRSVLSQDYDDFEVVIVDDGSTDKSLEIVEHEYPKIEGELGVNIPVTIIKQENGGPSKARNTGVKYAKGDWVVFLDADDELTDGALRIMMDEVAKYLDADIIDFGGYIRNGDDMNLRYHSLTGIVNNPMKEFYFRRISPGCGHSIFKADFVRQYPYNERIRRYEDCEILLRMLLTAKVYSSQCVTEIHNGIYAEASGPRKNIKDDFTGYLDISNGGFWYKMNIFKTFIEERDYYPEDCRRLYKSWYWRYDLLIVYKILQWYNTINR